MSTRPPFPSGSPGEDDSWESLAKDLFGIDFAKAPQPGEIVPPEELDEDEPPSEPEKPEAASSKQSPPAQPEPAAPESGSDSAEESDSAEDEGAAEEFAEGVDPVEPVSTVDVASDADEPPEADQTRGGSGETALPKPAPESRDVERDTFWDALEQFDEGEPLTEQPTRAEDTRRSSRPEPPRPASQESPHRLSGSRGAEEYLDDPEFGAGILEDEPPPAQVEAVSEETEKESTAGGRGKRRKRVRRRRRGASRETGEKKEAELHEEEETWEEVSEGEPAESGERESRGRRSRRRTSRRRRQSTEDKTAKEPVAAVEHEDDSDWDEEIEEIDEEGTSRNQPKYRKVPTWEEAVSYLLDRSVAEPRHQKADAGGKSRSKSSKSSKSSGRRGRRRRRS